MKYESGGTWELL